MKRSLGNDITFIEGLPPFKEDLRELDPRVNNICVLDDLMDIAVDSPIISKLFTQGRHRNASVILMLQNAFPKGKHNTSISRNAQYSALFRSPSDRRQIGMIADRVFDKNKPLFMDLYSKVTSIPYSYVLIDNKPDTPGDKQVITDVFGRCTHYPQINGSKLSSMTVDQMKPHIESSSKVSGYADTFEKAPSECEPAIVAQRDVLRKDDPRGPLVLTLSAGDWLTVADNFDRTEASYNPPSGWTIWRVFLLKDYRTAGLVGRYPVLLRNGSGVSDVSS